MTEQNRVFYRIEKLPIETRVSLVKEMLPKATYKLFKERLAGSYTKEPIGSEQVLDKLSRATKATWAFLHEAKTPEVVEYEIYARFDDPDSLGTEIFMHVRVDEATGFEIKNRHNLSTIG